eukprot:4320610-Pyramimonas_sp.AAC.1
MRRVRFARDRSRQCCFLNLSCEGNADMGGEEPHANPVTGAFGGAPHRVMKRVREVPQFG